MTNHPLTDDLCYQLRWMFLPDPGQRENMRNAADWQLEQCLEFLRTHEFHKRDDYEDLGADSYADLLEKAMRPTQENNS